MPAQPRKSAQPRKAAKKATAAVRARREVRNEGGKVPPLSVKFRGETFEIPRDRLGSARVLLRIQHFRQELTVATSSKLLFDLLGSADSARFIDTCEIGDGLGAVAIEFLDALNKAGNVPNS